MVQFVLFPLVFISGTYLPIHSSALNAIAGALPVRPFNQALLGPFAQHTGVDWKHLAVLVAWGAAGALVAIRRFRWDPRPNDRGIGKLASLFQNLVTYQRGELDVPDHPCAGPAAGRP